MRQGSIARWMIAIGLSGPALVYLRGWLGPANHLGFLGLFAFVGTLSWIAWLAASGARRWFFAGFGATALVLWVAILI